MNLDGGEDELFIGYNKRLEDDQEMVEEVQEIKQLNLENKLFDVLLNSQIDQKKVKLNKKMKLKILIQFKLNSFNIKMKNKMINYQ